MLSKFAVSTVRSSSRFFCTKSIFPPIRKIENNIIAINSSVQIYKGNVIGENHSNNECYVLMHKLREEDTFPENLSKQKMIELFFPNTSSEMALSLSNVTSAFYGIMLQTCGKVVGMDNIDSISKDFFYNLGKTKTTLTKEAVKEKYEIPKDARGVVILLVSAIYNASPEYKFQIKQFDKDHCIIELTGVDRYYRITKKLGIENKLEWPVLHRFLEGVRDEMKIEADVKSEMVDIQESGECHERFTIRGR